ncbi:MAG: TonB family protein [Rikenellaceae bacterium]|nr:TonB family protein [Rikenellaceae bacterium]
MLYYRTDDKKGKVAGAAAGAGYVLLWVLMMLFLNFTFEDADAGGGILIDFGDTDTASGLVDPDVSDITDPDPAENSAPDFTEEDIATQDFEEAPEVVRPERPEMAVQQPQPAERVESERPRQEPAPTVNPQALFPGRTESSRSTSQGSAPGGSGNQGSPDGSPQGDHDGTGSGGSGTGFSLAGRSVVGALPSPSYGSNKQGRVVVEITVNPAGNVINAVYRPVGSNTNDEALVAAALRAARQSRFNKIDGDDNQTGTITYNFRLK